MTAIRRLLAVFFVFAVAFGCSSTETQDDASAAMGNCCEETLAIYEGIPECCKAQLAKGPADTWGGCCAEGMAADTPDADRPGCCRTTLAKLDSMPACCRTAIVDGNVGACCVDMIEEIRGN